MERLFVYGTLAPGKPNHKILADVPGEWKQAMLRGVLIEEGWGSEMGCPGIVPTEDGEEVDGYVFSSEHLTEHWSWLDDFEGDGYERVLVTVRADENQSLMAYVYALKHSLIDQSRLSRREGL